MKILDAYHTGKNYTRVWKDKPRNGSHISLLQLNDNTKMYSFTLVLCQKTVRL